jgi:hypothetical protein
VDAVGDGGGGGMRRRAGRGRRAGEGLAREGGKDRGKWNAAGPHGTEGRTCGADAGRDCERQTHDDYASKFLSYFRSF